MALRNSKRSATTCLQITERGIDAETGLGGNRQDPGGANHLNIQVEPLESANELPNSRPASANTTIAVLLTDTPYTSWNPAKENAGDASRQADGYNFFTPESYGGLVKIKRGWLCGLGFITFTPHFMESIETVPVFCNLVINNGGNSTGFLDSRLLRVSTNRRHSFEGIAGRQNRYGFVVVVSMSGISREYERAQESRGSFHKTTLEEDCRGISKDMANGEGRTGRAFQSQTGPGLQINEPKVDRSRLPHDTLTILCHDMLRIQRHREYRVSDGIIRPLVSCGNDEKRALEFELQFVERRFISGQQWTPDLVSGTSKETLTIVLCRLQPWNEWIPAESGMLPLNPSSAKPQYPPNRNTRPRQTTGERAATRATLEEAFTHQPDLAMACQPCFAQYQESEEKRHPGAPETQPQTAMPPYHSSGLVAGHSSGWVPLTLSISAHQQPVIFGQTKVATLRALPSNASYHNIEKAGDGVGGGGGDGMPMNRPQTNPGQFLAPFLGPGIFSRETVSVHTYGQEIRRVAGVENVLNPILPVFLLGPLRQSIGSSLHLSRADFTKSSSSPAKSLF
ncbi:hypothetical protein CCUS01_17064 [Colletotrichum cuscutae]|uniref:Uncharacterized protein n=1 Tax=Colletotrichum cuscutae TaxID=1209917 RepID=A0AAI9V7I7_9PEZI|nr:hypothetical protein CCUS01_17064 [Colletotrichum cuscutae]